MKRDYYEVLGLSKGADAGSIKKAYVSRNYIKALMEKLEEKRLKKNE